MHMSSKTNDTSTYVELLPSTTTTQQQQQQQQWKSCFRSDLFAGKVALVTGGGTGIGRAIATELAWLGARHVVLASRNVNTCRQTAQEINQLLSTRSKTQQHGLQEQHTEVDVVVPGPATSIRDEDQVRALVRFVVQTYGSLDLLVNNAGGQFVTEAQDISKKGFTAVVDTNLVGTFLVCREAYQQYMKENGGGSIVNITLGNRNGMPGMVHSGAARAGIENMTATLSTEWMDANVRINCVRPGIIWTESGFAAYGSVGEMLSQRILPTLPARRYGTPQEVSSAVCWLLSEGASYVTGSVVSVDGASAFTLLPLVDIDDTAHLLPSYGVLPRKAKL